MTKHDNVSLGEIMKATEFVKEFGWDWANEILMESHNCGLYVDANINVTCHQMMDAPEQYKDGGYVFHREDLERLVESYELVGIHGYESSKEIVANAPSDDHFYSWALGDSGVRDKTVNIGELRKAIADVEACHEVN